MKTRRIRYIEGILGVATLVCLCGQAAAQTTVPSAGPQFSPRPAPTRSTQPPSAGTTAAASSQPTSSQPSSQTSSQTTSSKAGSPQSRPATPSAQTQSASPAPAPQELRRREIDAEGNAAFYVLKPGDTVDIIFRYTPEFNDEVVIGPDGRASLKATGDIRVAGRTLPELKRIIVAGSTDKLVDPEVDVSLKDFERPHVVVAGEVQNPQKIELRKSMTVLQAILIAGGPKDDAALGRVILFRRIDGETAEVHVLKLGKYDARTRAKNDLQLEPGDMILVRHDHLSKIERYVKLANIGFYLNPFGSNGIF